MMNVKVTARVVAVLGVVAGAVACSSSPEQKDAPESTNAAPAQAISGSLNEWQDAVCADNNPVTQTNTAHTVGGSSCIPVDGDGTINIDHFDSESSRDMVLSWAGSRYAAEATVNDQPLVIWTPAGESSDLDPLKQFGFSVVPAGFVEQTPDSLPQTLNPSSPPPPAAVVALPANQYGYVVVQAASGLTECMVQAAFVGCQTAAGNWPANPTSGAAYHGVRINADGTAQWVDGNLGADRPVTLTDQTYHAIGWTITTSGAGMRFTNDATGHGGIVSEAQVQRF